MNDYMQNAGYTCANCGQWIPWGQFHSCYNTPMFTYHPELELLQCIITLLEEIKQKLDTK